MVLFHFYYGYGLSSHFKLSCFLISHSHTHANTNSKSRGLGVTGEEINLMEQPVCQLAIYIYMCNAAAWTHVAIDFTAQFFLKLSVDADWS